MNNQENELYLKKHVLLHTNHDLTEANLKEIEFLKRNFCGIVTDDIESLGELKDDNICIYIFGDINHIMSRIAIEPSNKWYVIKELSYHYDDDNGNVLKYVNLISLGEVPININNVGVFFRKLFDDSDYFDLLTKEHQFQLLTESNKPGSSYRKGIYLSNVEENNDNSLSFNLLRCSTNLDGPTDNFRDTDKIIINKVNAVSNIFFKQEANLNHVLAQVYNNMKVDNKERKAKIAAHSDKTKDMPANALMAFCTFYNFDERNFEGVKTPDDNKYDRVYKDMTVFTKLRFRLKDSVKYPDFEKQFDITLYPGSVFIMSLETNRLYTHEIVPAQLSIEKLPIRLGYVIRCSKTKAVFKDDRTFIESDGELKPMSECTAEKAKHLKDLYFKENTSTEIVDYGEIDFSFNDGDYVRPLL